MILLKQKIKSHHQPAMKRLHDISFFRYVWIWIISILIGLHLELSTVRQRNVLPTIQLNCQPSVPHNDFQCNDFLRAPPLPMTMPLPHPIYAIPKHFVRSIHDTTVGWLAGTPSLHFILYAHEINLFLLFTFYHNISVLYVFIIVIAIPLLWL